MGNPSDTVDIRTLQIDATSHVNGAAIDAPLVRGLLEEQHPDLAGLELRRVRGGWDMQMWRLGTELAVRLPLTPSGPELLRNEQRWLPGLAARLPLPMPVPVRNGKPSCRFPRPWSVMTWVPGEPADGSPVADAHRLEAADSLAGFLRALHVTAPADAPVNPMRDVSLADATASFAEMRDRNLAQGTTSVVRGVGVDRVDALWADAASAPAWEGPPVWRHADLHPANVVVTDGRLSGIIDFGDLCVGDPAQDLAAAWTLLPSGPPGAEPATVARFFASYGERGEDGEEGEEGEEGQHGERGGADEADEATVRRAKGWALFRALMLLNIGHAGDKGLPGGKPTWGPAGRASLERVLTA
ncbi:aminoglycoside phosphotransferase family protein [Streptomyces sp. NBC_00237]|uniref:aminoglycoside phosphotransferase family protein n=1 Tax=Streptomyces sp. NBC_00237 TaxID=2975687 RepID=UPI00225A29D5|nr:aminoglycoside phosphotransferase family protein [Streptomyces sp. NBC_00237]MCX5206624.1 aminoglycoside phosphotransferase family protein [Streptomyces sp. NBC_00237]